MTDWLSLLDIAMSGIFLTVWIDFLCNIYHSFCPYVAAVWCDWIMYVCIHSFLHIRQVLGKRNVDDGLLAHCATANCFDPNTTHTFSNIMFVKHKHGEKHCIWGDNRHFNMFFWCSSYLLLRRSFMVVICQFFKCGAFLSRYCSYDVHIGIIIIRYISTN